MSLRRRLQRLERHKIDRVCPACRKRRGQVVMVESVEMPDGTVVATNPLAEEPQPCTRCGQIPEQIIRIVEVVVEKGSDIAELGTSD